MHIAKTKVLFQQSIDVCYYGCMCANEQSGTSNTSAGVNTLVNFISLLQFYLKLYLLQKFLGLLGQP